MIKNVRLDTKELTTAILRSLRHPSKAKALLRDDIMNAYGPALWTQLNVLGELDKEITAILTILSRTKSINKYKIMLKTYVIFWNTLSDVIATLINRALDLGIAERDLSLEMILRNQHVEKTKLESIRSKYSKLIKYGQFRKLRNDIIHRGKFDYGEYQKYLEKYESTQLLLLGLFEPEKLKKVQAEQHNDMQKMVKTTVKELSHHYSMTVKMINEIISDLKTLAVSRLFS